MMQLSLTLALALLAVLCPALELELNAAGGPDLGRQMAAHLAPSTLSKVQEDAARAVISRVIGRRSYTQFFQVAVNKRMDIRSFKVGQVPFS